MTWHLTALAGANDKYKPTKVKGDETIVVPFGISGHSNSIESSLANQFELHRCYPTPDLEDLLNCAIAVYAADVRIPRATAYDGWTRDIKLHMPVRNLDMWLPLVTYLQEALAFLTGDHWSIALRARDVGYKTQKGQAPRKHIPIESQHVCLFSGGLDSYIGAVDLLSTLKEPVVLVGHHGKGGGPTSVAQDVAITALRKKFTDAQAPFLKLWVSIPKGETRASEITTRGRSILFISLGLAIASGVGAKYFYIPENGLISLNVPLTNSRLGSFSTRTTHPYFIYLLRKIVEGLGLNIEIVLPYQFKTKGEMLSECKDQGLADAGIKSTMSCSHPGVGRWRLKGNPNQHCGYCVPCIIRRAAIRASRKDLTTYGNRIDRALTQSRGADIKAFKMALERFKKTPPRIADLLASGPLPVSDVSLGELMGVFQRGLSEVRTVLG